MGMGPFGQRAALSFSLARHSMSTAFLEKSMATRQHFTVYHTGSGGCTSIYHWKTQHTSQALAAPHSQLGAQHAIAWQQHLPVLPYFPECLDTSSEGFAFPCLFLQSNAAGVMLTSKSTMHVRAYMMLLLVVRGSTAQGCCRARMLTSEFSRALHGQKRHAESRGPVVHLEDLLPAGLLLLQKANDSGSHSGRTQHTCGSPSVLIWEGRNRSCLLVLTG